MTYYTCHLKPVLAHDIIWLTWLTWLVICHLSFAKGLWLM